MQRAVPILFLTLAVLVAGCGDDRLAKPRKPVKLTLTAPRDGVTTREATATVSGSVAPARSRVLVLGQRVSVSGGRFETSVDLREGSNVIDVGASATGARATWRALRVTRSSKIELPDVRRQETVDAVKTLEDLGLDVTVTIDDGLFDAFRSGPRVVCSSDPENGTQVQPASAVELVVSKKC